MLKQTMINITHMQHIVIPVYYLMHEGFIKCYYLSCTYKDDY